MKPKLIPYNDEVYIDYNDYMSIICKKHMMKMDELRDPRFSMETAYVRCIEGPHQIMLDKKPSEIRKLLTRRIDSKKYQEAEYFDIDGYLVPASKEAQVKTKNGEYTIKAQVKKSEKKGEQIVIYAFKKGLKDYSQIFIDPTYGKLTFDQGDMNPKDIFIKLEATFRDSSKAVIEGSDDGVKE